MRESRREVGKGGREKERERGREREREIEETAANNKLHD